MDFDDTASEAAFRAEVRSFLEAHPVKAGQRTVDQTHERLDGNVTFRAREAKRLAQVYADGD